MSKRLFCADIEADGLLGDITKLWCATVDQFSNRMEPTGNHSYVEMADIDELFTNPNNILIMHNGLSYDGPAMTKVRGIKVEAEIIDTLFLSWYLYPLRQLHGLKAWGEDLGIIKPTVDDWTTQPLEVYVERCEEDVKIQTALWKQMWKHLMLMYKTPAACWHIIRHITFKAKCAALQEKDRWKLDVDGTIAAEAMFVEKYELAKAALTERLPDVPEYSVRKRPKKCFNANGSISKLGERWRALVEEEVDPEEYYHGDPLDHQENVRVIIGYKEPNAGSSQQIKNWLTNLGWVPESFKYIRDKETNKVRSIPQIKNQETEELCESIARLIGQEPAIEHLREMSIVKHRITVVQGFLKNVDDDGYVYAAVQGLTNTLRFKHKICCNIPSNRKLYGELIRGLLQARSPEMELCGSDLDSLEDRTKQHYMWKHDPEYVMEMMKPDFDPHCDMAIAANLMTPMDAVKYKSFDKTSASPEEFTTHSALALVRHAGKSTNYAATYGATGPTIARSAGVEEEVGDVLHEAYWKRNWSLIAIADECITMKSRNMEWLWNPVANIWIYLKAKKDRFSTLNQSTATYAFDRWVFHILEMRTQMTGQFHDEVVLELKKGHRDDMTDLLNKAMDKVNDELQLNRKLSCGTEFGNSYAEVH
jgi:hypothetical protein